MSAARRRDESRCGRPAADIRRPREAGETMLAGRSGTDFEGPSNEV
jgi:hypothetical protein